MTDEEMPRELWVRRLARAKLESYRSGKTSLRRLVDDLDTYWNECEPSTWRDEFRQHWWTLEQIYAVGLDRQGSDALPGDTLTELESALTELEALLGD